MKLKLSQSVKPEPIRNQKLKIPEGFQLLVDTREQLPLFTEYDIPKIRTVIHDGDYSIVGYEDQFAIERKQVSDFFSYIGKERDKTVVKLRRMSEMEFSLFVVEASLEDLIAPQLYTRMKPGHVWGFLKSLTVRYGIPFLLNRNREVLERYILDCMIYYYKIKNDIK